MKDISIVRKWKIKLFFRALFHLVLTVAVRKSFLRCCYNAQTSFNKSIVKPYTEEDACLPIFGKKRVTIYIGLTSNIGKR